MRHFFASRATTPPQPATHPSLRAPSPSHRLGASPPGFFHPGRESYSNLNLNSSAPEPPPISGASPPAGIPREISRGAENQPSPISTGPNLPAAAPRPHGHGAVSSVRRGSRASPVISGSKSIEVDIKQNVNCVRVVSSCVDKTERTPLSRPLCTRKYSPPASRDHLRGSTGGSEPSVFFSCAYSLRPGFSADSACATASLALLRRLPSH